MTVTHSHGDKFGGRERQLHQNRSVHSYRRISNKIDITTNGIANDFCCCLSVSCSQFSKTIKIELKDNSVESTM